MTGKPSSRWVTPIHATDTKLIDMEPAAIWNVLVDIRRSEHWWPQELRVKATKVTPNFIGSEYRIWPHNGRPFYCRVVGTSPQNKITMEYFGDFISGNGEWTLEPKGSQTLVSYTMNVEAQGLLVALVSKMISLPNFHSQLMSKVLTNLEKECKSSLASQ